MGAKPFSEETARVIDAEVHRIINESHNQAKSLLSKHRKALDEQEILAVTGLPPAPALEPGRVAVAGADREVAGPRA